MVKEAFPSTAACPWGWPAAQGKKGGQGLCMSKPCSQTPRQGASLVGCLTVWETVKCYITEPCQRRKSTGRGCSLTPRPQHTPATNRKCTLKKGTTDNSDSKHAKNGGIEDITKKRYKTSLRHYRWAAWRDLTIFTNKTLNVVKRSVLSKMINRMSAVPTTIPNGFFMEFEKAIGCLPERTNEAQSASEKVPGFQPPVAIKVCSGWIKNLTMKDNILEEK